MTLCPIAFVAGCKKCPAFSVCPLKTVIGDQGKPDEYDPKSEPASKKTAPGRKK
jgi:hypothetical protein